jgi:hypothetical protein
MKENGTCKKIKKYLTRLTPMNYFGIDWGFIPVVVFNKKIKKP